MLVSWPSMGVSKDKHSEGRHFHCCSYLEIEMTLLSLLFLILSFSFYSFLFFFLFETRFYSVPLTGMELTVDHTGLLGKLVMKTSTVFAAPYKIVF